MTVLHMAPDGKVYKDGVFTGTIIKYLGMTPKYCVDCSEFFRNTFEVITLKHR